MPGYEYRGITPDRQEKNGTITAKSKSLAAQALQEKGLYITYLKEKEIVVSWKDQIHLFRAVKVRELAIFCRQFSVLFESGLPLIDCLATLQQQTSNKSFASVLEQVKEDVEEGETLHQAVRKQSKIFPDIFNNMVEAGETGGILDQTLNRLALHFEKEHHLREKVKSAMVYPFILVLAAAGMVLFMLVVVLPNFVSIFASVNIELPPSTRALLAVSQILREHGFVVFVVAALLIFICYRFSQSSVSQVLWARLSLKTPVIKSLVLAVLTARFARTLGTLLSNGMPILGALEIVAPVIGNEVLRENLLDAREQIQEGDSLAAVLQQQNLFPPMLIQMMAVGEQTGRIDQLLDKAADFYEKEVDHAVDRFASFLEPALILVMGGIVGFIVSAVMLPMFEMINMV